MAKTILSLILGTLQALLLSRNLHPLHREYMLLTSVAASDCLLANVSAFMSILSIYLRLDGTASYFELGAGHAEEGPGVSHNR